MEKHLWERHSLPLRFCIKLLTIYFAAFLVVLLHVENCSLLSGDRMRVFHGSKGTVESDRSGKLFLESNLLPLTSPLLRCCL